MSTALPRKTPDAINKVLTLLNVDRYLFLVIVGVSFLVMNWFSFPVGVGVFLVVCVVSQIFSRKDEQWLEVFLASWNFPTLLDPFEREIFELEIVGEVDVQEKKSDDLGSSIDLVACSF